MSKLITTDETANWLKERDKFLIITHRRPDGDTLGCAGALAQGLREFGKTAFLLFNPEVTPRYQQFVKDYWADDDYTPDTVIAVDTASLELFPKNAMMYKDTISLCIDHHGSNSKYAEFLCLYDNYASCGEIVYDILKSLSDSISKETAERLYVAVSTDTGCFSFGNTTSNTLCTAARLIEAGAPHKSINKTLFRTKTRSRIELEGMLDANIDYSFGGKVAIAIITMKMIESSGVIEDDLDDISALPGSIEGVSIGIIIREMSSEHDCKISVRSQAPYDSSAICSNFGGGGHKTAAGATIAKTVDEIKADLLEILKEYID